MCSMIVRCTTVNAYPGLNHIERYCPWNIIYNILTVDNYGSHNFDIVVHIRDVCTRIYFDISLETTELIMREQLKHNLITYEC